MVFKAKTAIKNKYRQASAKFIIILKQNAKQLYLVLTYKLFKRVSLFFNRLPQCIIHANNANLDVNDFLHAYAFPIQGFASRGIPVCRCKFIPLQKIYLCPATIFMSTLVRRNYIDIKKGCCVFFLLTVRRHSRYFYIKLDWIAELYKIK